MKILLQCVLLAMVVGSMAWLRGRSATTPLFSSDAPPQISAAAPVVPTVTVDRLDLSLLRDTIFSARRTRPLDLEIAGDLRAERAALTHIFAYLAGQAGGGSRDATASGLTYADLMSAPDADIFCGKPVAFTGVFLAAEKISFAPPLNGIDRFYVVTAADATVADNGRYTWTWALLNPPPLRRGDLIRADGVFLKKYPYATAQNTWQWSPLAVGLTATVLPPASPLLPAWLPPWAVGGAAGGLVLATGAGIYLLTRRDDKNLQKLRARRTVVGEP
ncbi:hypothetical protein AGMMS49959_00020 [Planctomycetales bacterium]|nr:hypothetical protein AGMMS49959_00020 [Planctomycetales bacterium]